MTEHCKWHSCQIITSKSGNSPKALIIRNLDFGNMLNSSMMFAMDLSRIGDNKTAAKMLSSTLDSIRTHLDSTTIAGVQQFINQYKALSKYNPYKITVVF